MADHSILNRIKARLASLRERFGDDDPDVKELAAIVEEPEAPPASTEKTEGA